MRVAGHLLNSGTGFAKLAKNDGGAGEEIAVTVDFHAIALPPTDNTCR